MPAVCKALGRSYLAFEIDTESAERARERVRNVEPMLVIPDGESWQMPLLDLLQQEVEN